MSNQQPTSYPDGLDIEIFNFESLKYANFHAKKEYDKEHVTSFLQNNKNLKKYNITHKVNLSQIRLTLDELEDYETLKDIFKIFKSNIYFGWKKIVSSIQKKEIKLTNTHLKK